MHTVLVVDDLEADRRLVGQCLGKNPQFSVSYAVNGEDALQQIRSRAPDIVLTDLQMPELNGLELVRTVRREFPRIPVVLMTAHGNELVAVEALRSGAANYVPKSHLNELLLPVVQEVLVLARISRGRNTLIGSITKVDIELMLDNQAEPIPQAVELLQRLLTSTWACDTTEQIRVGVAVEEALLNAAYHGNLEITQRQIEQAHANLLVQKAFPLAESRRAAAPYSARKVFVRAQITAWEARFTIRDEGPGFDLASVAASLETDDFTQSCGRGLQLMRTFMDEVSHNDAGNEVVMFRRRPQHQAGTSSVLPEHQEIAGLFELEQQRQCLIVIPNRNVGSFAEEHVQAGLAALIEKLRRPGVRDVVFDFAKIAYFGSSMLQAIHIVSKQVARQGGKTVVCHLSSGQREVLRATRLDTLWPMYSSRASALEAVCSR